MPLVPPPYIRAFYTKVSDQYSLQKALNHHQKKHICYYMAKESLKKLHDNLLIARACLTYLLVWSLDKKRQAFFDFG